MNRWLYPVIVTVSLAVPASNLMAQDAATDAITAAANARKAQADAEAAAANAETAKYTAQEAAAKAKLGALADVAPAGSVEVGTNSGLFEATLLSSDATRSVATAIIDRLKEMNLLSTVKAPKLPPVIIAADAENFNFDAYNAYQAQVQVLEKELISANNGKPFPKGTAVAEGATSGGLLTAFAIVANLFRSDYKVSSITLTPSDMALIKATARAAIDGGVQNNILVPSLYPKPLDSSSAMMMKLAELQSRRDKAVENLVKAKTDAAQSKKMDYSLVIAQLESAIKHFDEFASKVSTADAQGNVLLATVARQEFAANILRSGGMLLTLKADAAGGSAYAKKNFWTFFGELPFSVSAGAVASFALISGKEGLILDSGVVGKTSPYMKVNKISKRYEAGFEESPAVPRNSAP